MEEHSRFTWLLGDAWCRSFIFIPTASLLLKLQLTCWIPAEILSDLAMRGVAVNPFRGKLSKHGSWIKHELWNPGNPAAVAVLEMLQASLCRRRRVLSKTAM